MIKATAGNLIILGLSDENITRLKQGMPIVFNMAQLGIPDKKMFIFAGETEEKMQQDMKQFIRPELRDGPESGKNGPN